MRKQNQVKLFKKLIAATTDQASKKQLQHTLYVETDY